MHYELAMMTICAYTVSTLFTVDFSTHFTLLWHDFTSLHALYTIMSALVANGGADEHKSSSAKEYQTLFWVPMLFQTAKNAENLIEEMLDMIQDFHDSDQSAHPHRYSLTKKTGGAPPKRRQQILGEVLDSEVVTTRVDVVLKSDNTKYNLLSVLKRHFLFSQLRDYELEDVIDVMQALYVEEGQVIIQEGDPGELFYILEEGACFLVFLCHETNLPRSPPFLVLPLRRFV